MRLLFDTNTIHHSLLFYDYFNTFLTYSLTRCSAVSSTFFAIWPRLSHSITLRFKFMLLFHVPLITAVTFTLALDSCTSFNWYHEMRRRFTSLRELPVCCKIDFMILFWFLRSLRDFGPICLNELLHHYAPFSGSRVSRSAFSWLSLKLRANPHFPHTPGRLHLRSCILTVCNLYY